jgi:hypothetical protein
MKPTAHVYTSAALAAALYAYSHSVPEAALCFAGGTLIDLDHLIDFHLFSGEEFTIKNFFSWCHSRWQRLTLIFHSYELFCVACAVAYYLDSTLVRGVLWGAGLHLLLDQIGNQKNFRISPWFYFLIYRAAVGFRRENLQFPLHGTDHRKGM